MTFRDEREASAARIEALERELAATKARLERAERARSEPIHRAPGRPLATLGIVGLGLSVLGAIAFVFIDGRREDAAALARCERDFVRRSLAEAPDVEPAEPPPDPMPEAALTRFVGHATVVADGAHPPPTGTLCTIVADQVTRRACRVAVHCEDGDTPDASMLADCAQSEDGVDTIVSISGAGVAYDRETGRLTWGEGDAAWMADVDTLEREDSPALPP